MVPLRTQRSTQGSLMGARPRRARSTYRCWRGCMRCYRFVPSCHPISLKHFIVSCFSAFEPSRISATNRIAYGSRIRMESSPPSVRQRLRKAELALVRSQMVILTFPVMMMLLHHREPRWWALILVVPLQPALHPARQWLGVGQLFSGAEETRCPLLTLRLHGTHRPATAAAVPVVVATALLAALVVSMLVMQQQFPGAAPWTASLV